MARSTACAGAVAAEVAAAALDGAGPATLPPRDAKESGPTDNGEARDAVPRRPEELERRWFVGVDPRAMRRLDRPVPQTGPEPSIDERPADGASRMEFAQFQLPPIEPDQRDRPPRPVTQQLTYQYSYGSESSIIARRNQDLDKAVRDNTVLVTPQINGLFVYRPTNWLLMTLEMFAEVEIPWQQPETIQLPNGTVQPDQPTKTSVQLDQGFVTVRGITAPFEFNVGRRNYEDERHWLYDTSLDIGSITFRQGALRIEAFAGREVWKNGNFWPNNPQVKDRINTTLVYVDYRGIEDHRLAAYSIRRNDLTRALGEPRLSGVRAMGRPTDDFNYWGELAYLSGRDATGKPFAGVGYDVGFTYRFTGTPLNPNFTLGYAYGSGDDINPNATKNRTFQQTGLESNESRFAGIPKFKYYGEVLDPQLSNLKIATVGIGAYPAPTVSVDLVYHRYLLAQIAEEVSGQITAQLNQIDIVLPPPNRRAAPIVVPVRSRDVGREIDLIVGIRQLFGIRRLGVDLRFGWFFPGQAFRRNDGTEENPQIHSANKSVAFVAKFWW